MNYLYNGGRVYVEGADVALGNSPSFNDCFGMTISSEGDNNYLGTISGEAGAFTEDLYYTYLNSDDVNYLIDDLLPTSGNALMRSSDNVVRVVSNTRNGYRTIISSVLIGAMLDGIDLNTKTELMERYIEFLMTDDNLPPEINTIESISVNMESGQIFTESFVIANNGGETLEFEISLENPHPVIPIQNQTNDKAGKDEPYWLSVSISSGIIAGYEEMEIELTFNADDLNGSEYNAVVYITSNDPDNPLLEMPVTMFISLEINNVVSLYSTGLLGNYPNPFNPSTSIKYSLAETGKVELSVYNLLGQKVKTLFSGIREQGINSIIWNSTDDNKKDVSSGVYFLQMTTQEGVFTRKILLLK